MRWLAVGDSSCLSSLSRIPSRLSSSRLMPGILSEDVSTYFSADPRTSLCGGCSHGIFASLSALSWKHPLSQSLQRSPLGVTIRCGNGHPRALLIRLPLRSFIFGFPTWRGESRCRQRTYAVSPIRGRPRPGRVDRSSGNLRRAFCRRNLQANPPSPRCGIHRRAGSGSSTLRPGNCFRTKRE